MYRDIVGDIRSVYRDSEGHIGILRISGGYCRDFGMHVRIMDGKSLTERQSLTNAPTTPPFRRFALIFQVVCFDLDTQRNGLVLFTLEPCNFNLKYIPGLCIYIF